MLLEGGIEKNYTQNWDKNGNIYYTDENGRVVDFKVNPFVKLANKVKAGVSNFSDWINESNPNSEAYKQKIGLVAGLATAPFGIGELATAGVIRALAPYVGRKIAQNMATGLGSGVVGGGVSGGLEAGLNNENILAGGLKGSIEGGTGGLLFGYGLGKIAQKLNAQTAWHGSPYKFDKFSNEAIGTGEGAQAHGYGHYAALNKDVAQGYADRLGNKVKYENLPEDIKRRTEVIGAENTKKELIDLQNHYKNLMSQEGWGEGAKKDFANKLLEINSSLESLNNPIQTQGNLYKLSIPKDDVMLREHNTYSKQPLSVQKSLDKALGDYLNLAGIEDIGIDTYTKPGSIERLLHTYKYSPQMDAGNFYDVLSNYHPNSSKFLDDYGIKGISYNGGIDGEARVIFNPDDIDIIPYYDNPTNFKEKFINLLSR